MGWGVSGWMGTENYRFCENSKKKMCWVRGGGGGGASGWGSGVDVHREVKFFKKKIDGGVWGVGVGWGSGGDPIRGWGGGGSKVWGRWGMGDVNQE